MFFPDGFYEKASVLKKSLSCKRWQQPKPSVTEFTALQPPESYKLYQPWEIYSKDGNLTGLGKEEQVHTLRERAEALLWHTIGNALT